MFIHLSYIKNQIHLRKHLPQHQNLIGSILKHKRLEKRLTLEELVKDNCSVSYWSKVENNMIKPSPKFLEPVCEKLNLELGETFISKKDEIYELIIENFFHQTKVEIDEAVFKQDDYSSKICHLGYYIMHHNFQAAKHLHQNLYPYIKNMNDVDLQMYLYFTALILKNEGRLHDAFKALNLGPKKALDQEKLEILSEKLRFELAFRMNNHLYMIEKYVSFMRKLNHKEYYHIAHDQKYFYASYMAHMLKKDDLIQLLDDMKHLVQERKIFVLAKRAYLDMEYKMCLKMIRGYETLDDDFYKLSLFVLDKLKEQTLMTEFLKKPYQTQNKQIHLMRKYFEEKYLLKRMEPTEFIQTNIIKFNELSDDYVELNFWYEEGLEQLKAHGYYKDATLLSQLIFRKLRDLSTKLA